MRGRSILLATTAVALGAAACGGDDDAGRDVAVGDTLGEVLFDTADGADDDVTLPADFGEPCDENTDCASGFCVEGPGGFVCTRICDESCPDGWSCKGVTSGSADVVFLCIPDGGTQPDTIIGDTTGGDTGGDTAGATDTGGGTDTGGATDTTGPDTDTVTPAGAICDPISGTDNFRVEASDWPDCLDGCPRDTTSPTAVEIDLVSDGYNGFLGLLDGEAHVLSTASDGPDIDIIGVTAPARTMLEIGVFARDGGSLVDPLIYTTDGISTLTYNDDVAPGDSCARTTIGFPYTVAAPLWIVIEDAVNYAAGPEYEGPTVGGTDYGYAVRIRMTPFAPTELGPMAAGTTQTVTGELLSQGGQTRYYRLSAPGNARPTVTLTRTGSSAFIPAMTGFKTNANQLVWQLSRYDDDGNGVVVLPPNAFEGCVGDCGGQLVEYVFAVQDWNGDASPGAFSYDLLVSVP